MGSIVESSRTIMTPKMKTTSEANWNRQAGRQTDAQDHVLSQADALTKNQGHLSGFQKRYCN